MRGLIVVLVACGTARPPVANHAGSATTPAPCPKSYDELTAVVNAGWGAGAHVDICIPLVRGGKALWWLEGHADAPPDTMHEVPTKRALLDGHTIVWSGPDDHAIGFGYGYGPPSGGPEATDLDGDGNDEVLYERITGEGGMSATFVVVVYFEPNPVAMELQIGASAAGEDERCDAKWSVVSGTGRAKRILVEKSGNACEAGDIRNIYERRGTGFEKI